MRVRSELVSTISLSQQDLLNLFVISGSLWEGDVPSTWSQEYPNTRQPKRNSHNEWGGQQTGGYPTGQVQISNHHTDAWGMTTGGKGTENPYPMSSWGPTGTQKPTTTNDWAWTATQNGKPVTADPYPGWSDSGGKGPVDASAYGWGVSGGSAKTPIDAYPGWPADGGNRATEDSWPGGFVAAGGQQRQQKTDRRAGRVEPDWTGRGNQFDDLWENPGPGRGRTPHKNNQSNMYEPSRTIPGDPWGPAPQTDPNKPMDDWNTTYQTDYKNNPQAGTANAILNALRAIPGPGGTHLHGKPMQDQERGKTTGKKSRKNKKQHEQSLWPMEEEPVDSYDNYDNPRKDPEQAPWSTTIGSSWGEDSYSLPSKAFALASDGRQTVSSLGPKGTSQLHTYFVDSRGEALLDAEKALFSPARLARNRIHWTFSPLKDERVSSLLEWIELMKPSLATYGVRHPDALLILS